MLSPTLFAAGVLCVAWADAKFIPALNEADALKVHAHNPIPLASDPLRYEHYSAVTDTVSGGVSEFGYAIRVVAGLVPLAASLPPTARVVCTLRAVAVTLHMPVAADLRQKLTAAQYLVARAQQIGVDDASATGCLSPKGTTGYRRVLHVDVLPQADQADTLQITYVTRPAGLNEVLEPGSTLRIRHRPSNPTLIGVIDQKKAEAAGEPRGTGEGTPTGNGPAKSGEVRIARQVANSGLGGNTCTIRGRQRFYNQVCEEPRYGGSSCADNTDSADCAGYFDNRYGVTARDDCPCRGQCTGGSCLVGAGCPNYVTSTTTMSCRACPSGGCGPENTCWYSHNNECNEARYGGYGCAKGTDTADCHDHLHARFGVASAGRGCFCLSTCVAEESLQYPFYYHWCKVSPECTVELFTDNDGDNKLDPNSHAFVYAYCDSCGGHCSPGNTCSSAHNDVCEEPRYSGSGCADGADTADCSAFLAGDFGVARVSDEDSSDVAFVAACRCRAQCDSSTISAVTAPWCRVDAREESCKVARGYDWSSIHGFYYVKCLKCKGDKCNAGNDCRWSNDGICDEQFHGGGGDCLNGHDSADCDAAESAKLKTTAGCHCLSLCQDSDNDILVCAVGKMCSTTVSCAGSSFSDDTRCGECEGNDKLKNLLNIENDPSSYWRLYSGHWQGKSGREADATLTLDCVGCGVEVHIGLELSVTFRGFHKPDFTIKLDGSAVPRVVLLAVAEGTITWDYRAAVPYISEYIDSLNAELALDLGPVGLAIQPTFGLDYRAQFYAEASMSAMAGMQVVLNMSLSLEQVNGQRTTDHSFSFSHQLIGPQVGAGAPPTPKPTPEATPEATPKPTPKPTPEPTMTTSAGAVTTTSAAVATKTVAPTTTATFTTTTPSTTAT